MWYRIKIWFRQPQNRLWLWPALASLLSVVAALAASLGNRYVDSDFFPDIDREALDDLLSVIASSMLSVTTFSLGIMVSAFGAAANGATPRATALVMGDDGTRQAISAFIAAFIYAVVAKIALGIGYYGQTGRFILFVWTLGVLIYLIVSLLRWVRTLTSLGRLSNTLNKIEATSLRAIDAFRLHPHMGGLPGPAEAPAGTPVSTQRRVGYVSHIDVDELEKLACTLGGPIHIRVRPGSFVGPRHTLAIAAAEIDEAVERSIRDAFVLSDQRSFDQDPRFGFIVLSEVAQRALSPAVNDPGTAIQVMSILCRLLVRLGQPVDASAADPAPYRPHLTVVAIDSDDFVTDGFEPISRDGAAILELGQRLQKLLAMVGAATPALAPVARRQAERALARAEAALPWAPDAQALRALHASLFQ